MMGAPVSSSVANEPLYPKQALKYKIMANQTLATSSVKMEKVSTDDNPRSYDLYLPVYSYFIGLFIIFVGKYSVFCSDALQS